MKLSLNHLNLPSKHPQMLRQWYADKLGFTAHDRFLWSNGTLLVFDDGAPLQNEKVHFGFRVGSLDELQAWVERLRSSGVDVPDPCGDDQYMTVYIKDPEGNKFEIFHEPAPDA